MTNKQILQTDMLDILFEHRNKNYGAYVLRKTYNQRLGTALGVSLAISLLFIMMSFINRDNKNDSDVFKNDPVVILTDVELPPPPEPELPQPVEEIRPPEAEVDFQRIVIRPDVEVVDVLPTIDEISNANISNQNIIGEKPTDEVRLTPAKTVMSEKNTGETENNTTFYKKEISPKFPGAENAWLDFLRRYLQSPEDLDPGKRITVVVRFLVDVDGSIAKPEIVKSGGKSFDNEVLSVLKKMPKWEPGEQNGQKVAIAYTQTVTFLGMEE